MVPCTDKDTDFKRQLVEFTLERSHQVGPLPIACSGQLHALIPLMPERLGPLRELLVIERAIGLDRTNHMPVPTATEFEQSIGSIPTVTEHIDVEPRGQQPLEFHQHVLGQHRFLAKTQSLRGGSLSVQTPYSLLPQVEAPLEGSGASTISRYKPAMVLCRASETISASARRSTCCSCGWVRRSCKPHKKARSLGECCTMRLSKGISFLEYALGWHS